MSNPRNLNTEQTSITATPLALGLGTAGVDLREGAASRSPLALREFTNGRFVHDRALGKRAGHRGERLRTNDDFPQVEQEEIRPWLYGWGDLSYQAFSSAPVKPPYFPDQTRGAGAVVLDDTLVVSTGDRLLTRLPGSTNWLPSRGVPFYAPTGTRRDRVHPSQVNNVSAITAEMNGWYDTALSDRYEVTLFLRDAAINEIRVTVRDLATDSLVMEDHVLDTGTITKGYVVFCNDTFVAIWADGTDMLYSWANSADPTNWAVASVWDTGSGDFDVELASDERFLVVHRDGSSILGTMWLGNSIEDAPFARGTVLAGGANGLVAAAVGRDGVIGIVYQRGAGCQWVLVSASGANLTSSISFSTTAPFRISVAPHWNYSPGGGSQFTCWIEGFDAISSHHYVNVSGFSSDLAPGTSDLGGKTFFNSRLVTRGFRVGDLACVGMNYTREIAGPNVQGQVFFVAMSWTDRLRSHVVASFARGEVNGWPWRGDQFGGYYYQSGVRPLPSQGYNNPSTPSTTRWSTSLLRWPEPRLDQDVTPQMRQIVVELDFLPPFRATQYGRAVYSPGAVVHEFDGQNAFEAGFLQFPEVINATSIATGAAAVGDIRAYRVYACHANRSGEISRSPALTFIAPAITPGNLGNRIRFTTIGITSKSDVYFEIYVTEGSAAGPGATFYLADFTLQNDTTVASLTWDDDFSNSALRTRPADPHPAVPGLPGELLESAPPGCSLLAGGKGRLWFAGGEIPRGRLAFSKLREEQEQVGWSALTGLLDLDYTGRRITSIGVMADVLVAFQSDGIYGVQGDGPTNLGAGFFSPAQLIVPGVGADTHSGTALTEVGMVFWGAAGPRLLTTGFQVTDISQEVEPIALEIVPNLTCCVSVPGLREARWYTSTGTALMWDYSGRGELGNRWSVWNNLPTAGGVHYPVTGGAVLVTPTGYCLLEDQTAETDGGNHYEFAIRTGDVRPTDLLQGRNRFIQLAIAGEYKGPHTLGLWTFYDDSPMWNDYITWVPQNYLAVVGWGSGTGTWDTDPTAWIDPATQSPDGVYRFLRRLERDKGSLLSLRLSDQSAPNNSFIINEIAFLIAPENGLAQTPPRTFGGNPS